MNNTDLISRSALLKEYNDFKDMDCPSGHTVTADYMIELAEAAPAVDAEPVRHGRWVYKGSYMDDDFDRAFEYSCSICGRRIQVYDDISQYPYCHCGARMDGDEHAAD